MLNENVLPDRRLNKIVIFITITMKLSSYYNHCHMVLHNRYHFHLDFEFHHCKLNTLHMIPRSLSQSHLDFEFRQCKLGMLYMVLHSQFHPHLDYEFHQCKYEL